MKNIFMLICLIGLFAIGCSSYEKSPVQKNKTEFTQALDVGVQTPIIRVQDVSTVPEDSVPATQSGGVLDFVKNNVAVLAVGLMAFLKIIVNLTPTEKDNKVFGLLDNFINWIVPNFKSGGGTHT